MKTEIRKAQEKDIPKLLELLKQVNAIHAGRRPDIFRYATKYSAEELKKLLANPSYFIFVAADEKDEAEGYAICLDATIRGDAIRTEIRNLYLDDLCVDEKARGGHIGTKLLDFVKSFAKEQGFDILTLNVWELDKEAKKFYLSQDMQVERTTLEYKLH
jgi:ribosomal protein S18 acetylase RimI-like enzyme